MTWLVDSESALDGAIKGCSDREDLCSAIVGLWEIMRRVNVSVFLDRVPTDGKLGDHLGSLAGRWPEPGSHPV